MWTIFILVITYINTIHSTIDCDDSKSCKYTIWDSNEKVYCDGDYACSYQSKIGGEYLRCNGNYGCGYTDGLHSFDDRLDCDGYRGCIGAELLQVYGYNYINCRGYQSCLNVDRIRATAGYIACEGSYACQNAKSFESPLIKCTGIGSCLYTLFSSANYATYTLHATGVDATDGADYVCESETTSCEILCYGTGCKGLTVVYPNKKSDIDITPQGCKADVNQGKDIGTDEIVMWCPTFVAAADYNARDAAKKRKQFMEDIDVEMFHEVDTETFFSAHRSFDAKEILLYGSMVLNGIIFASCMYQRYKKKEYLPL